MSIEIPAEWPQIQVKNRIAIVGGSPTKDEAEVKRPFVGANGNILSQLLTQSNILRSTCYLSYVAPFSGANRFGHSWNSWQVQKGLQRLKSEIDKFDPNIVVLCGQQALKAAGETRPITDMRGTLFQCLDTDSPFYGRKCLATFDPLEVVFQYKWHPLMHFDLTRAAEERESKELILPARMFDLYLTCDQIIEKLANWKKGHPASIDIEGGVNPEEHNGITCMSIAESPEYAFVIDWRNMADKDKPRMWDAVRYWMADPDIPKIAQNMLYENFCCPWKHKMPIGGIYWDTMLSGWEIYPELPKALGVQASIYTREPHYKYERKIADNHTHLQYCCKDTTVTYEIYEKHKAILAEKPDAERHFHFNMGQINILSYMQLRGMRYDVEGVKEASNELQVEMDEIMTRIELYNGEPLNPNSPKQMNHALYVRHRFEKQYQKEKGRKTNKLTSDVVALLTLFKKHDSDLVYNILKWKHLEGQRKQLICNVDPDNRIRATYNPVGTETGRYSCAKSNNGSGYNLQTTTKALRKLFPPDPDNYFFQCDLAGADGWTVAAHAAKLGDERMLNDYLTGVKPAKTIACLHLHKDKSIGDLDSDSLLALINSTEIPPWLYAACKAVQHGSCYGMKGPTMSSNILKSSWKHSGQVVYVSPKDCLALQDLFFHRYSGVLKWQSWVRLQLEQYGELSCASGHTRRFFGRRNDHTTYMAALAHEPQANTTYATSLAAENLWLDKENRSDKYGRPFIIEPLHQVHDALCGQFPISQSTWSVDKIRSYFDNKLTIANQELVIPYEGEYGEYWGDNSGGTI